MKKVTLILFIGLLFVSSAQIIAQNFTKNINAHFDQLLEQNDLLTTDLQWIITSSDISRNSNIRHIYFTQVIDGIEINGTQSSIHILPNGKTLSVNSKFIKNSINKIGGSNSSITVNQALISAANQLNYKITEPISIIESEKSANKKTILSDGGFSLSNIPAKLVYHITSVNELVLAWDISIQEKSQKDWWSIRVNANTGEILDKNNWMLSCSFEHDHSTHKALNYNTNLYNIPNYEELSGEIAGCNTCYEVIAMPIESPYFGTRSIEVGIEDAIASPYGWHDTNGIAGVEYTVTRGNNVNAYEDGDNPGYQPDGGASLDFSAYPFSQTYSGANQYEDAAITNLFYWNNIIHDVMYQYGFDEAGGNFQEHNYGNGGLASDSVNAEAQDGSGTCNANFGTPSDGFNPTMQMYTCGDKDGDFDNLVIVHEYGHGISNRLTGGPSNSGCLSNAEQMGEGWSDFYGVMMTMDPGDTGTDVRAVGTYLFGQGAAGSGIRNYPYSTDMAVNPQTYGDVSSAGTVHAVGEIWAAMLWDLNWELIDDHGFDTDIYNFTGDTNLDAGNIVAMAIVTEAMKLQPCSPGFVDGRDAILAADLAIYGGANECAIWDAFARRGLGLSADQGSSSSRTDGTEAFDTPSGIAAFTAPNDVCASDAEITGLSGGTPSGGVYSGTGVTDDGNGSTFSFDPIVAGVGVHTISYDVPAGNCTTASTASDNIEVLAIPPGPSTTGVSDFCLGDEITVSATLGDPNNVIRWYDSLTGGNFLFEGEFYSFTPAGTTNVYAQETAPGPISKLVVSEINLETPDLFEIQNVGQAFDYTGYSVALSDDPYSDINSINSIVQSLGNMNSNSVIDWNDNGGTGYWGSNIWWSSNETGWIIIIDDIGNVVDSVFWNLTAAEISNLNVTINGFNVTSADLDWAGGGASFLNVCGSGSYRRVGDSDSSADWSGSCETADFGFANDDIGLGFSGCLGERTLTEVTVDLILPTISCSVDIEVSVDPNNCFASGVTLIDPSTSDNCGVQSLSNDAPSTFPIGDTNVIWTVTDVSGNTNTCTQLVTVIDDIDPIISCAVDIEVGTDTNDCVASGLTLVDPTTSDNCGIQSVTNDAPTDFQIGDTNVIWTVTDNSGNTNTCIQVVTVVDDIDPEIICPDDLTEIVNEGELFTIPDYSTGTIATDNCTTTPIITQNPAAGIEIGIGITVITMTATDSSGNVTTCTFNLTIDETLGINDLEFSNSVYIFPNPANQHVTLVNKFEQQLLTVTIHDINGRIINKIDLSNSGLETKIQVIGLANGVYFMKIDATGFSTVKRLLKN